MRNHKKTLWTVIVLSALGLVTVLAMWIYPERAQQFFSLFSVESIQRLVDFLRSLGWIGPLVSIGFMMLQAIIAPLPSFVIASANGMVYGIFWGTVISWIGGMAAAMLSFWLARRLGYEYVQKLAKKSKIIGRIDQISGKMDLQLLSLRDFCLLYPLM